VINGIYDTIGVGIHTLPAVPEKIKTALEAKAYFWGGDFYDTLDKMQNNPVKK